MFDVIENPINKSRRILRPVFFGHLDGFVNSDVGRNVREKAQLIDRKAQDVPLDHSDTLQGPIGTAFLNEGIDLVPVPYHPGDQGCGEVPDLWEKHRLCPCFAQHFTDIGTSDLERVQNL